MELQCYGECSDSSLVTTFHCPTSLDITNSQNTGKYFGQIQSGEADECYAMNNDVNDVCRAGQAWAPGEW